VALTSLLEGAELAPPERLPALVAAAGKELGIGLTVYVVDYEQRHLRLVPPAAASLEATSLDLETTLASRAFRRLETLPALRRQSAGHPSGLGAPGRPVPR
jgi:hypothetical protein